MILTTFLSDSKLEELDYNIQKETYLSLTFHYVTCIMIFSPHIIMHGTSLIITTNKNKVLLFYP